MKLIRRLSRWNFHSITNKMTIAFSLILIIPSLSIGLISYNLAKNKIDEQMQKAASSSITLLNQTINQLVEGQMKNVDFLASQLSTANIGSVQGDENPEIRKLLDSNKKLFPELEGVNLATDKGVTISSPIIDLPAGFDVKVRPYYIAAMSNKGKVAITDPFVSAATGNLVISISKVTQDGHGVLFVNLSLESLGNIVKDVKIGSEGYVLIFDKMKKYLAAPDTLDIKLGDTATGTISDTVEGSNSGTADYISPLDGKSKNLVFSTNPLTGWKILGSWDTNEVAQEASAIFNTTALVIAIALLTGGIIVFFIIRSFTIPMTLLTSTSEKISAGDLRQRVNIKSKNEFGQLGASFNQMVDSLRSILVEVSESSGLLAASSEQLAASAEESSKATEHISGIAEQMSDGANQQTQQVEQSSQTIYDTTARMQQVTTNIQQVTETTVKASAKSAEGGRAIHTAVGQMNSISGSVDELSQVISNLASTSHEIGQITEVITQIAQQTNLLSLNASIEAARAGEHGRGFAVVANEVKKLAEKSSKSTEEIANLIGNIQEDISKAQRSMESSKNEVSVGMNVVHQAGSLFSEIESFVDEVGSQVQEVSEATLIISNRSLEIDQQISEIAAIAQSTAAGAENVSAASEEQLASMQEISSSSSSLTKMAEDLQLLVDKFKL
ncbi:methyl-accepting chemotaxis protein [Paenibacillus monticola]|uniref:HAMP domain-containing protein n=1 Tax=Paenibacillus monticola TaxID=2666075 RepID=A0A7X2H3R3_9BACL|nr:methyl-accepting chemotaxis protein [Paenibacillus monticola]MRN52946.1 HAMP domain-containing protein [Paenibacillus monticola]